VIDLITSSGLGSLLGVRHALEPDHLAAVTTLVSRERSSVRAALLGACWGLGHTLALVVVGALLIVLRKEMPPALSEIFELAVACMLIGLGVRAMMQAVRQGPDGPEHLHRHGHVVHSHAGVAPHLHVGSWTLARRPLLIGAVHGLAGSGALTALVLATLPTTASQLSYMALFGLGSTFGMAALSGLLGWPLARFGTHHLVGRVVTLAVGGTSTALGFWWGQAAFARLL